MTGHHLSSKWRRPVRDALSLLSGAFLLAVLFTLAGKPALAQFVGPTQLTLVNGWTDAPSATSHAMIEEVNGIVHFRGAIAGGASGSAFTVPGGLGLRPAANVYIPVDLCNANKGRLFIQPTGRVSVQAEKAFSDAQCLTSLDGATYAPLATGFTTLTLINGWRNAPFGTSDAAVEVIGPRVVFKGAISTTAGGKPQPFTLPVGFRPSTDAYVTVDMCAATNGRLHIAPSGLVDVEAEGGTVSNAQCFTSLDGAWFAFKSSSFVPLAPLLNGWTNAPFGAGSAQAIGLYGVVYFKGAIASGTSADAIMLSTRFRPVTNVHIPVNLCNANKGTLVIQPNGVVSIQAEKDFGDAQCFTSLDGASFVQ